MTTINNDRVTLKAAIESGDAKALAAVLLKMGDNTLVGVSKLSSTFRTAVDLVPSLIQVQEKNKAKEKAAKDKAKAKAIAAAEKVHAKALKDLEAEQAALLATMLKPVADGGMGLNPMVARLAAEAEIKIKRKALTASPNGKTRVNVTYNGESFDMPVTGNMPNNWKQNIVDSGMDRDAFIDTYKTVKENA